MKKDLDVIGLGVSTVDIFNVVDHFPDKEEVQKSLGSAIEGGGPVATAMVTLARLGAKVMMIDSTGDDWRGKFILEEFKKENVNTEFVTVHTGFSSSSAVILVRQKDGARTIVFSPGNAQEVPANIIKKEIISRAKYIHVNGRHFDACLLACKAAKQCGTKISFDGGANRFSEEMKNIVRISDVCIVAKNFAFNYSGKDILIEAAKDILTSGPEIVIITDGLKGSFLFTNEIHGYHQKAFVLDETVDTTGCGDGYHGGFLFGMCRGKDVFESMKIASAVAAINSTKLGGRAALPDLNTVNLFLDKHVI